MRGQDTVVRRLAVWIGGALGITPGMALTLALTLALTSCAEMDRTAHADAIATRAGLQREQIDAGRFVLTAYSRIDNPAAPIDVYIEGDGLAWLSRTEPSLDPTPRAATGLTLAAADPSANVVYLARPCQFTPMAKNPLCGIPYWTGKRYGPEVLAAMDGALDLIAQRAPGQAIHLIGYSGGGAIVVLIAARRRDVASIRTVAGNLDDAYVNQLHGVSAMPESENPIDFASRVADIPQIHFSGTDDSVVPPQVASRFVTATGMRCAQVRTVAGIGHEGDWARYWPALLALTPACGTPK